MNLSPLVKSNESIINFGFEKVFLSGSGSTLFVLLDERKESDFLTSKVVNAFGNLICFKTTTSKVLKFNFEEAFFDEYY